MSSPYLDQLLTLLVSSAGSVIAKIGGAAGGGFNFVAPLTAVPNGATGNVDIGFAGGSTGGDVNPTANTFSIRDSTGQLRATSFATSSTLAAAAGAVRLVAGNQTVIALKGTPDVPILSVASSGAQVKLGDGAAVTSIDFANATLDRINAATFGNGVTANIAQSPFSGTGASVGSPLTIQSQAGQTQTGGADNNTGGDVWLKGGAAGTGGGGAAAVQGPAHVQGGGLTATIDGKGLTVGGGSSFSYVDTPVASAPANPASGYIRYYTDGSGHPTVVNSSGTALDLAGTVAANRGGTGLSSAVAAGNLLVATSSSAWSSALPASIFFSLDLTLTGGTKVLASGKDLTNAVVVSVRLKTATTATGDPVVTFVAGANGNVTVTSYTAGAIQAATDASTYTVVFAGAV